MVRSAFSGGGVGASSTVQIPGPLCVGNMQTLWRGYTTCGNPCLLKPDWSGVQHDDRREMVPLGIANPDSLGSRNKEVSLLVDFDSVGDAAMRFPVFVNEIRRRAALSRSTPSILALPWNSSTFRHSRRFRSAT